METEILVFKIIYGDIDCYNASFSIWQKCIDLGLARLLHPIPGTVIVVVLIRLLPLNNYVDQQANL